MNKYVFFQKHEKRRIAVILTMLICFAGLFSACGKKDENKEEKQKEPVILNPAADDPNLSDGEWAYDIWKTAIDKLYAEGAVSKSDISEDEYFKFETEGIAWSSPEAKAKYAENDFKPDGKCIWGCYSSENLYRVFKPEIADPNRPAYAYEGGSGIPSDIFANSRGECKYYVVYTGLKSHVDKNFYSGGADRTTISTDVIIFDAVSKEVVHIEHIGTNSPKAIDSRTTGSTMVSEAIQYMKRLFVE